MSELTLSVCVAYTVLSLMTDRLRRRGQLALSEQTPCLVSEPHRFEFLVGIIHCGGELSILTAAVVTSAIDELMIQSGGGRCCCISYLTFSRISSIFSLFLFNSSTVSAPISSLSATVRHACSMMAF